MQWMARLDRDWNLKIWLNLFKFNAKPAITTKYLLVLKKHVNTSYAPIVMDCYYNLVPRVSHLPNLGGKMRDPGNEVAATKPCEIQDLH